MTVERIIKIEKYNYTGKVYNVEVEPNHPIHDDQYYTNADTGLVVHNCHPRDNIALRFLAEKLDLGYDLFDSIMGAREIQAKNLAMCLIDHAEAHQLPIVIHGKTYKPDVPFCDGSYSMLVGHYVSAAGYSIHYVDPLADNRMNVMDTLTVPAVILLAHNRNITYGYTGTNKSDAMYFDILDGSVVVDPWRTYTTTNNKIKVIHYGNTRPR